MMNKIQVKNIFAAVFEKRVLDSLLDANSALSSSRPGLDVRFWGTEGTMGYVQSKGFDATSVVKGFDYDGRVKSLDRDNFVRILADRTKPKHLQELRREARITSEVMSGRKCENTSEVYPMTAEPFDVVVVDLYVPDPKIFPESMDIGGMSLIRAAIKNYKNVAVAFDEKSIKELATEIKKNSGSTALEFRRKMAKGAAEFIASRTKLEARLFKDIS